MGWLQTNFSYYLWKSLWCYWTSEKMPFVPFDFVILPPGHGFWSLPIFAIIVHCNTLFRVTFGHFCSIKNLFGFFKFPWNISEGSTKNSFFNLLEKVLKTKPKKVLHWTKNGSKSHFWNHFWFCISFFGTFFCSLRVLLRGQL